MVGIPVLVSGAAMNKTDTLDPPTGISLIREHSVCLTEGKTTETTRVLNEQLILVKHDGMTLGKVGHATAHNNWSLVRNMRHLTEIPNNTPSAIRDECKCLSEINLVALDQEV